MPDVTLPESPFDHLLGTEWSSDRAQKMTLEEATQAARRINVARANVGNQGVVEVVPWPNKTEA